MTNQRSRTKRRASVFLISALLLISTFTGATAAQTNLPVEVNAPSEVTAGESAPVSALISVPEVIGTHESELTVTLLVDGETVNTETVTIHDGETTTTSVTPVFDSPGTHEVTVEAEISVAAQSFSGEASTSVRVTDRPEVSTPGLDGSQAPDNPTGSITSVEVSGPAFSVPASLKDEVESYRQSSLKATPYAFVLAKEDQLYLIFSKREPTTGLASVSGIELPGKVSAQGMSFEVILAQSVSFETRGQQTTVQQLSSDPNAYSRELVQVRATHRQISVLTDTDQGEDPSVVTSAGVLVKDPITANDLVSEPGAKVKSLAIDSASKNSDVQVKNRAQATLQTDQPRVFTFDFQTGYWSDSEQVVNGIVLTPGSKAREFVSSFDSAGVLKFTEGKPLLYIIDSSSDAKNYDSMRKLSEESNGGELVSIEANVIGQRISVQESIEHSTSCGETVAQIQTPSGPVCVDLLQDNVIDVGAAWTSSPESGDDVLFMLGISSQELDQPSAAIEGRYRITGEVVSTARVDDSLPEGRVFIVYERERTGEIQATASGEAQKTIESKVGELRASIQAQLESDLKTKQNSSSDKDSAQNSDVESEKDSSTQDGRSSVEDKNNPASQVTKVIGDTISQVTKLASDVIEQLNPLS